MNSDIVVIVWILYGFAGFTAGAAIVAWLAETGLQLLG